MPGTAIETGNEVLLAFGSPDPDVEQIIRVYPGCDWVVADKDWRDHRLKTWRACGPTDVWEYGWQFADDHLQGGHFGWIATSLARPALALTKQVARPIFQASRALQQGAASRLRAARDSSITQCAHQICRSSEITEAIVAG